MDGASGESPGHLVRHIHDARGIAPDLVLRPGDTNRDKGRLQVDVGDGELREDRPGGQENKEKGSRHGDSPCGAATALPRILPGTHSPTPALHREAGSPCALIPRALPC